MPTLSAARLQRWALIPSAYDYDLKYRAGEQIKEADMLSRLPLTVNVIDPNHDLFKVDYCETLPVTAAEVARDTQFDPTIRCHSIYSKTGNQR